MGVFDTIYRENKWGGLESRSGPGAGTVARENLVEPLLELVKDLEIKSVLDVGCGDGFWMPDLPGYIGIDVTEEAISRHRERYPDRDLRIDDGSPYPETDLTISRCVMQHLSYSDGLAFLSRVTSKYLLATTNRKGQNVDIDTGGGYWICLERPPFNFGPPERFIKDGHSDEFDYDNVLGLWKLY